MPKERKIKLTHNEASFLFQATAAFIFPDQLGERKYDVTETGLACEDVHDLFRGLKAYTEGYDRNAAFVKFGKSKWWEEVDAPDEKGVIRRGHRLVSPQAIVTIRIDEDQHLGAFWCLVMALHSKSPFRHAIRTQADLLWPLVDKLGLAKMIHDELGFKEAKHRRLDLVPSDAMEEIVETGDDSKAEKKHEDNGGTKETEKEPAKANK